MQSIEYKGIRIAVAPGIIEGRIKSAFDQGWYELEESRNMPYILQEGERVVELGAGLGFITAMMARDDRVEKVIAFEANPQLAALATATAELNGVGGKIEVRNAVAMADPQAATAPFYLRDQFWASSMDAEPWGYIEEIAVPVEDINALIRSFQPTLLVVDIEGGERFFFDGVDLTGIRKIFLEVHQNAIGRTGMHHVFQVLGAAGFHYDQWHSEKTVILFSHVDRDKS